MSRISISKLLKARVESLLMVKPDNRDNDDKLISNIWYEEATERYGWIPSGSELFQFLHDLSQGEFTSPESITRARRKVQEENPGLRGEKYKKRHENQENVKWQLGYNPKNDLL